MEALPELLGSSPGIVAVREQVRRILLHPGDARRLPPVLIQGETGSGKGLLVHAMHRAGPRRAGPFVDVNCAAIPETLLEAEMFGFERGAFTDARQAKPGLFTLAHGGTIFLDEVGLLPEAVQAKLLKVLEDRQVRRLGATRAEPVDAWVIAATNEDLQSPTRRFRADLYHRLAVMLLTLPPLRERGDDVLLLAEHLLTRTCGDYGTAPKTFDADVRSALLAYAWPGNVRELSNAIERAVLLGDSAVITAERLGLPSALGTPAPAGVGAAVPLQDAIHDVEHDHLVRTLEETGWNISRTAERLGISRNTARYRISKHGLVRGGTRVPVRAEPRGPVAPEPHVPAGGEITTRPTVRWERRRLTFLRVGLAPGEASFEASRTLEALVEKIQSFGGRVEELGAAGVVAAFGLEPVENAPRRAANAALAIRRAVDRSVAARAAPPPTVVMHVAEATIGRVNGDTLIDQEARREVWRTLDEMAARAEPGAMIVSGSARPLLARWFELAPVDRGESGVWRLAGPERRGVSATAPGVSLFVGRQHELDLLDHLLVAVENGHGQVVGIAGDAGIGKTRLVLALRERVAARPITVLQGDCLSYGGTTPYLPLLDVARGACGIDEADTPAEAAAKVRSAMAHAPGLAPYLLRLLELPDSGPLPPSPPDQVKARTFEALRDLILRAARQRPIILVIEDLHWIDRTSEEFIVALVEALPTARVLFSVTYRGGYRPSWLTASYATQLALQPLGRDDCRLIVSTVLDADAIAEALIEMIITKAEGNAFFVEELARAVRGQPGAGPVVKVPDTIEDVLLARLDQLPADDKRVLQCAAVGGRDISPWLVAALADVDQDALPAVFLRLQTSEFIHVTSGREAEYVFNHVLTQEVAYGSVLPDQRRSLHARAVGAIERREGERRWEHCGVLAFHAVRADLWESAVDYLRASGTRAFAKGAVETALTRYEEALALTERLAPTADNARRGIDIRLDLNTPLIVVGQLSRVQALHDDAEALARGLDDQPRLGRVLYRIGQHAWMAARYGDSLRNAAQARVIGAAIDDAELRVLAAYVEGITLHSLGEYRASADRLQSIVDGPDADVAMRVLAVTAPAYVGACAWLGLGLTLLGDVTLALVYTERAIAAAEDVDHPQAQAIALTLHAIALVYRGNLAEATAHAERALTLCRTKTLLLWLPVATSTYGWTLALAGRASEGLVHLEKGAAIFEALGLRTHLARLTTWYAEGLVLAGRPTAAVGAATRAIEIAAACGERGHEAEARYARARALGAAEPLDSAAARSALEDARSAAERLGMRPLGARCRLDLGRLCRRVGEGGAAREHLVETAHLFQEMDLRGWLAEAEAALTSSD